MPAFVGPMEIESVTGVFKVGDTFTISPKSVSKSAVGSGALSNGDGNQVYNSRNITNDYDSDVNDQSDALNA
ncbi:spore germination protein [Bacillus sp. FJAT-42376]|uniref:spore germination protein n=1 Tax=Bacillus sp. FJAT-42376 TaxID=2014076 RepID=UPI000F4E59E1|nr:spore germination protein [Bacillus sp. FJAT-42376]AZB44242.1 spore germination protein [Bacillus sp. FJAT-42376]